jgi:hypothetical protein
VPGEGGGGGGGVGVLGIPSIAKTIGKLWFKPEDTRYTPLVQTSKALHAVESAIRRGVYTGRSLPQGLTSENAPAYQRVLTGLQRYYKEIAPFDVEGRGNVRTGGVVRPPGAGYDYPLPQLPVFREGGRPRTFPIAPDLRPEIQRAEEVNALYAYPPEGRGEVLPNPRVPRPSTWWDDFNVASGRLYSTQPRRGQPPPIPTPDWRDALWQLAETGLEWWLQHRQQRDIAKATRQAWRNFQRYLAQLAAASGLTGGGTMPYPITSFAGGGASWADALIGGLAGATRGFLAGGNDLGYDVPYFPDVLVPDVIQRGMATSGAVGGPFAASRQGARAQRFLLPNPATGALTWFGPLGQPILWSRDLSTVRRVRKVGAKARRWCGRVGGR